LKYSNIIITFILSAFLAGCAAKITAPSTGATSKLNVEVTNFAEERSITNTENVYLTLKNADESWGGEQLIKNDQPKYSFTIPAKEELMFTLNLMQGGGGFSSSCGATLELKAKENSNLTAKFNFFRGKDSVKIIGCTVDIYSGNKLLKSYKGSSNITLYKVKFLY